MPFHRCKICLDDGSTLCEDITVKVEETERGGATEWYGSITLDHRIPLTAGQCYRLVLGDGRAGEFTVRRNTFAGDTNRAVAIHGLGPLE